MKRRLYFDLFKPLVKQDKIKRAKVLMGPRRVGKTVMLFHLIQDLIDSGVNPRKICYLSIDNPIYSSLHLEQLFDYCRRANNDDSNKDYYVIFDEIQYLKGWEQHLKTLVDTYHYSNLSLRGRPLRL